MNIFRVVLKVFGLFNWLDKRAERKQLENERKRELLLAAAMGYLRYRAEVGRVRYWRYIVEEEDRLNRDKKR